MVKPSDKIKEKKEAYIAESKSKPGAWHTEIESRIQAIEDYLDEKAEVEEVKEVKEVKEEETAK